MNSKTNEARYINANALLEDLKKQYGEDLGWQCTVNMSDVGMIIEDAPTADVVPMAEVAKIFEEIEKVLNRKIVRSKPRFEKLENRDEKSLSIWGYEDRGYFKGVISSCEDLQDVIDKLKKKYPKTNNMPLKGENKNEISSGR